MSITKLHISSGGPFFVASNDDAFSNKLKGPFKRSEIGQPVMPGVLCNAFMKTLRDNIDLLKQARRANNEKLIEHYTDRVSRDKANALRECKNFSHTVDEINKMEPSIKPYRDNSSGRGWVPSAERVIPGLGIKVPGSSLPAGVK